MRNFKNYISYVPKQFYVAVAVMALLVAPFNAALASWSPERETYTMDNPAEKVTFNSMTDNSNYGDERTFFDAKPASNTSEGGYQDKVQVGDMEDGDEVLLRMYVHNNAKESLNGDNFDGEGVAHNTRVSVMLPNEQKRSLRSIGYVSADNAEPQEVSDTVDFRSSNRPFSLKYVDGSAQLYNNVHEDGIKLSDKIVTDQGAKVGYKKMNGEMPGCFKYAAIVTLKAKVNKADVGVTKQVRKEGTEDWKGEVKADPGDMLEYLISFKNTGDSRLDNVAVGDNLPKYMSYVEGSTKYANASTDFEKEPLGSDNLTKGGVDLGNYEPGANAFVKFKAKLDTANKFEKCGDYTLRNVGIVRPFHESNQMNQFINTADVKVNVECEEKPEPEEKFAKCIDLSASKTKIKPGTEVEFTAELKTQNLDAQGYKIDFGDGSSAQVEGTETTHTYEETGEFEARVTHVVTNEGLKEVTGDDCVVPMKVEKKEQPEEEPKEEDEKPDELANTGIGSTLAGIFGSGALGVSVRSWLRSRRKFLGSMLGE